MKQFCLIVFSAIFINLSFAQEGISPLLFNTKLMKSKQDFEKKSAKQNEVYIYQFDTLSLPFLDDFSTDKFTPVSQVGDANVSAETFYKILISGLPDYSGRRYVDDTTYYIEITRDGDGNLFRDSIPNPVFELEIFDLTVYPPISTIKSAWIDTTYVDSLWNSTSPDIKFSFKPDFIQDSLIAYTVSPLPNSADYVWQDRFVYRSNTRGINPPTVGVATFDGTNDFGIPYNIINIASQGLADVLTSKALRFSGLAPSDSLYFSFYYQYKGNGDSPEPEDVLMLEFWSPTEQSWTKVWEVNTGAATQFTQVLIPIKDNKYYFDGFQFRFKNFATLSGAVDHWHIDYVYLNQNRAFNDFNQPDVAHRYGLSSLLKDYTSMPWEHYVTNPSLFMGDDLNVTHFNTSDAVQSYQDNTVEILFNDVVQSTMLGPGIVPDFLPQSEIIHNYKPTTQSIVFDPSVDPYFADFEVKSYYRRSGDFNPNNDTVRYTQRFLNYYSYDDGSAEYGYYVIGNNVQIAQKFTSVVQDTLRAVQIHFEPVAYNAQNDPFFLTVWKADGTGGQPGTVWHQNIALSRPEYIGFENDGYVEYNLEKELIVPAGDFYVGLQQTKKEKINIGLDISKNNSNKIYYNIDGNWFNSSIQATLMIRAVFKTAGDFLIVSTKQENIINEKYDVAIYPNPFTDKITIVSQSPQLHYQLFDISGKQISSGVVFNELQLNGIKEGIYILKLMDEQHNVFVKKIIKQ